MSVYLGLMSTNISIRVDLPARILDVRLRRLARERVPSRFSPCAIRQVNII
jgi:hypothetical protein